MDSQETYRAQYLAMLEKYTPALRRLCHSYCAGRPDAEDLYQEIALALWTALARFRGEASDRTWLYRIAHNVALTFSARRRGQDRREQPVEGEVDVISAAQNAESLLMDAQKQQMLQVAVWELPFEDRRLVLLYLEGLATAEIETVTGLTRSNVTVRLSRIRQRLADRLKKGTVRS